MKEWYYNHGRHPQVQQFGYIKPISLKYVVGHLKQDELYSKVKDLAGGAPPGSQAFLAKYQLGLKYLLDNLSAAERSEYQNIAKQWTNETPPLDVQKKYVAAGPMMPPAEKKIDFLLVRATKCCGRWTK